MRDKGIISQAEYDSAVHDLKESVGEHAPKEGPPSWASGRPPFTVSSRATISGIRRAA